MAFQVAVGGGGDIIRARGDRGIWRRGMSTAGVDSGDGNWAT